MSESPFINIEIAPEPTPDERDAIVASLTLVLTQTQPRSVVTRESRWGNAGRLEASGFDPELDTSWRRSND